MLIIYALVALLVGLSKSGIKGLGMLIVPLLAHAYGGKASTGILLPMLLIGDVFAVRYYNRHAVWRFIWLTLPPAVVGVLLATWVGQYIDDAAFKKAISIIVLGSLALLIYLERYPVKPEQVEHPIVVSSIGLIGGFCTMIGNAAGPIMAVYLLSLRLPKNSFIGTAAYFFLLINLFKVPFHILSWKTITLETLTLNLWALPVILVGFWLGVRIVKRIPEQAFRYFVMIMTGLVAIKLLIG